MNATEITVIGHVADSPRRVRLQSGMVTNFRLASTERRFDRERQEYVDGGTFWTDVECWGELGAHVSSSVSKGDPVIVRGTLTTRQWETENGRGSVSQIRAETVGHNLARGTATFAKAQKAAAPAASETAAQAGEVPAPADPPAGEDYDAGSGALYVVDSDSTVPEPALH